MVRNFIVDGFILTQPSDLEGVEEDREGITTAPLVLIDTAGMAARMECVKDGIHYFNLSKL